MDMTIDKLVIIGAGGHGRVAADIAEEMDIRQIQFLDISWPNINIPTKKNNNKRTENFWKIIGSPNLDTIKKLIIKEYKFFVAISDNNERKKLSELIGVDNLVSLIHPSSTISKKTVISNGSMISASVVINVFSEIGFGTIINTGAFIDHDCLIRDYVHVGPGTKIAGQVTIGNASLIGIGSNIVQNINIGKNVTIGAGSLILKDIEDDAKAFGSPAKKQN